MKSASGSTALSAAIGLAMAMQGVPAGAQGMQGEDPQVKRQMMKFMHDKMKKQHLEMCYGINAVGKNDCGTASHSCHGQATQARDPASFVLVPAGECSKIPGGLLKPG
ncbi:MAG: DUF2282 domain-containing protein [Hyphomicrobiales bacterium]|nr:DUF2282 domain-containing protein [Hyphomicrobiales bacterium]MBV8824917.1 DUF2282 domain-containing protein [Hyphomicrobiales bacterium]MBV9429592.1 DUF2282 domain-containing protein [Bradyrhizobiaceae bacterium]